jgi:hypothetical protein
LHVVVAAGSAVEGVAAGAVAPAPDVPFCTPPWPLQAPRPVLDEVVPSLQAVGSAWLDSVSANISSGAARAPTIVVFFMTIHSFGVILFLREL